MSTQTYTDKESKSQVESVNTTDSKECLTKITPVENTPFAKVYEDGKHFGIIGKHRITESFENESELDEDLKQINWNRITQIIWAVCEQYEISREIQKNSNNE